MLGQPESCLTQCGSFFSKLFHLITDCCFNSERQAPSDIHSTKIEKLKQSTHLPKEMLTLIVDYAEDLPLDPIERENTFEKNDLATIRETNHREKLLDLCLAYSAKRLDWENTSNLQNHPNYNARLKSEQEEIRRAFTNCSDIPTLKSHTIRHCQHYYFTMKKQMRENTQVPDEPRRESPALIV